MKLLVATRSAHKLKEIRAILHAVNGLDVLDLNDAEIPPSPEEDEIEVFDTFAENARAKARYFQQRTGLTTVADDSGLEVDALGGRPGVRSKRFAPDAEGLDGDERDRTNNEHLLHLLGDLDLAERTGRYVCVAALDDGTGEPLYFRGEADGLILGIPRGTGGFGYDPLFYDSRVGRTFAEISPSDKDKRSHRGHAFRALAEHLQNVEGAQP